MFSPVIKPVLDRDRAMQLTTLYDRLKERKISKDVFVKHMRGLVDDHILKLAVTKLKEQALRSSQAQIAPTQVASRLQCSQVPPQHQHMKMPVVGGKQFSESLKQQPQNMQAPRSSQAQIAPAQVASHSQCSQVPAQQQHMKIPAAGGKQFSESLEQQPQNMQANFQTKVDELTKEKIDLENRLKVALSEMESLLAQKSSWDKERTILGDKLKSWIALAVKAESSNSELASKLQTCEAIYKTKLEELQSVHNVELKKLQTELEEVRPDFGKSMDEAASSFQDSCFTCADKFAASEMDVTRKLFEDYCADQD